MFLVLYNICLYVFFVSVGLNRSKTWNNAKRLQSGHNMKQNTTQCSSFPILILVDSLSLSIYIISAIIPSSDQTLDIQTPPEKVLSTWTQKTYLKHPSSAGIWMFRDIQNLSHTHPTMYPSRNLLSEGHGTTRQG